MSEPALDIDRRAAHWLQQRQFWDWTDADEAAFETWLNESEAHRIAYWRQKATWTRTERLVALGPTQPELIDETARPRRLLWPIFTGIAAAIAAVAVLGVLATSSILRPQDRLYSTSVGGRKTIAFADGTRIELNTDTVLRARMTTDQRLVWLEKGEAYFQVKHDAAHPFVAMVGEHRVTDLGTEFVIHRGTKNLEVALLEGRAWFDRADKKLQSQSALLKPGDEVVATAGSMSVARRPAAELANELSWRRGMLVFKRTRLADAAAQFNRYNRQKLVVQDSEVGRLMIDGTFPTNGVQVFTDAVRNVFGLHIENHGDTVVISHAP
jgi:transmembrane sensor